MNDDGYHNIPLEEAAKRADEWLHLYPTAKVYQKWTCEKCGDRVTANNPNIFTTKGHHQKAGCEYITDMTKTGCGFRLEISRGNRT